MSESKYNLLSGPVLIVDDEEGIRDLINEVASDLRLPHIVTASSGPEALDKLGGQKPYLVITDFKMPGMTGLELVTKIKSLFGLVQSVLVTGFADKEVAMQSVNIGIVKIVEKPFDYKSFKQTIETILDEQVDKIKKEFEELESILGEFVREAGEILDDLPNLLLQLEDRHGDRVLIDLIFRKVHTLKGGAGSIPGGEKMSKLAHAAENLISTYRKDNPSVSEEHVDALLKTSDLLKEFLSCIESKSQPSDDSVKLAAELSEALNNFANGLVTQPSATASASPLVAHKKESVSKAPAENVDDKDRGVTVPTETLDEFMNLSGELVVLKNSVKNLMGYVNGETGQRRMEGFSVKIDRISDNLQTMILEIRKVELGEALKTIPRLVRQTSKSLGKIVALTQEGWEVGVDKKVARALQTCLIHMIRNSLDHGLESPNDRIAAGKPAEGNIRVSAKQVGDSIVVEVVDDGRGINVERVKSKAVEKNLIAASAAATMSNSEAYDLLFLPGFSTSQTVTEVSGRGVGMDAVKTEIDKLEGRILIESESGKGTKFTISIPIPKSVMVEKSLVVRSDKIAFALPQQFIERVVDSHSLSPFSVNGRSAILFEGAPLFITKFQLGTLDISETKSEHFAKGALVVLKHKRSRIALYVDEVEGQLEAVISPLNKHIQPIEGVKGTTLLSSDEVAYVLAPDEIIGFTLGIAA